MRNFRMYWFVNIIVFIFAFCNLSGAKHGKKLPSAVIVGTVYCDTCFQAQLSKPSHSIAGALVGVECKGPGSNPSFQKQVFTNTNGKFLIHLPFSVSKHVNEIEICSVKLIKSSEPYCAIASSATRSSFHLKAKKSTKTHIFSAGYFTFKPNLCSQKPTKNFYSRKFSDPTPVQNPLIPNLPPTDQSVLPPLLNLPRLPPLIQLPPLPPLLQLPPLLTLPRFPILPPSDKKMVNQKIKNDLEKTEFPNDQESRFFGQLSDKNLAKHKTKNKDFSMDQELTRNPKNKKLVKPKNENYLEKKESLNDQELTPKLQFPIFSSPPSVSGFQFPSFSFPPLPLNSPPNPFQVSPPVLSLQSPPELTNPLPAFPFQPSPGLPGFPPATEESKKIP